MKKIIKEHEHFEKFMGYKAPEFKSDSREFHVILWNLNYISNNKNEYAIGRLCLYLFINKSDDFILLVGMIPVNFCISLKPGELLAHVFTAMRSVSGGWLHPYQSRHRNRQTFPCSLRFSTR